MLKILQEILIQGLKILLFNCPAVQSSPARTINPYSSVTYHEISMLKDYRRIIILLLTRSAACRLAIGHASLTSFTGNPSNISPAKSTSGWFFVANVWNISCSTTKKWSLRNLFYYNNFTYLSAEIFERSLEYRQFHKYNWTFPLSYLLHPLLVDSKKVFKPEIFEFPISREETHRENFLFFVHMI